MSLSFPKLGPCFIWWGGPPGPRGTPSSRFSVEESSSSTTRQAGQGAGRGPGASAPQVILSYAGPRV